MASFAGFDPDAIRFLLELAATNDRSWFQPRKAEYERLLKDPLEALCADLGERFAAERIPLRADTGSPFRIYRDVRFSKDKSPYKTHISASFPWADGPAARPRSRTEAVHRPGGYFHFAPDAGYLGGGIWHPDRPYLEAWRATVATDPKRIRILTEAPAFKRAFGELEGEQLKRVPTGYPADHPQATWLKLKDVLFGRALTDDEFLAQDLPKTLVDAFATATPLLRFLAGMNG